MIEDSKNLLTKEEHDAVELCARLAQSLKNIIGKQSEDYKEAELYIHGLQNMILSQAAARAYPELYRQLGQSTHKDS